MEIDPVLGQLLPEPYQPTPNQPGGAGTPVTDPVQKVDEKTGMFLPGCGHSINSYDIKQMAVGATVGEYGVKLYGVGPYGGRNISYGTGKYGDDLYGVGPKNQGVPMKVACCPVCGWVQQILPVNQFDGDPFTFVA